MPRKLPTPNDTDIEADTEIIPHWQSVARFDERRCIDAAPHGDAIDLVVSSPPSETEAETSVELKLKINE
ncbi:hypothetical protein [Natronococcus wangiae]|uniref:hypothetical protein n=1 Tax=Natronococcus wangiae TaxID=3068275 RepID=UPI00273DF473|nr:hypothetical protein [Natronococcus sp. AD5]